jgi:uncharacterized membrane protein YdbT with pleckstrin-like domain
VSKTMYCIKCGTNLPDTAEFCARCGTRIADDEQTQLAKRESSDDLEQIIFSISPTLLFVQMGYVGAVVGGILLVIALYFLGALLQIPIPWWISVSAGLLLLLIPAYYHFKRNITRYTLTDSKVEIDTGFISRNSRNLPLRTIQDVTVQASIPQRLLGFGSLIIENANEADGKTILKNINNPRHYADLLLKEMRKSNR